MGSPRHSGRSGRAAEARTIARAKQLIEEGAFAAADAAYRQVLDRNPAHPVALGGRASTLAAYSRDAEELCAFGYECSLQGLYDSALQCYVRARELDPESRDAVWGIADSSSSIGDTAAAIEALRRYLELEPDEPEALHMLASHGVGAPPPRAADAYVADYFDRFAPDFDHKLVDELSYNVPGLLLEALYPLLGEPRRQLAIVDLGCGTGLSGKVFRDYAERLTGVDLSPAMLEKAGEREVYDDLVEAEIGGFLTESLDRYDLILAGDVLAYFGPLEEVLGAVAGALQPAGLFVFSVESSDVDDHRLTVSGRYAHGRDYIRRVAAENGLRETAVLRGTIRLEYGEPVEGDIWVFEKAL